MKEQYEAAELLDIGSATELILGPKVSSPTEPDSLEPFEIMTFADMDE